MAAGFYKTEIDAIDALSDDTTFSLEYFYALHRSALGRLYDFAGRLRTVNMSKDGFMFAPAEFLSQTLTDFERAFLHPLVEQTFDHEALLDHLASMHAELLFIHPFRDGNGRIIRLFTKLIFLARTGDEINFAPLSEEQDFKRYITAVQLVAQGDYRPMQELFKKLHPISE